MKNLIIFFCLVCFKLSANPAVHQMQAIAPQNPLNLKPVINPIDNLNKQRKLNSDLKFINSHLAELKKNPKEYLKVLKQMNVVLKEKVKLLSPLHAGMNPEEYLKYLRKMNTYLREKKQKLIEEHPSLASSFIPQNTENPQQANGPTSAESKTNGTEASKPLSQVELISDRGIPIIKPNQVSQGPVPVLNPDSGQEVGKDLWKIARQQRTLIGNMGDPGSESTKSDFKSSKQKRMISDVGGEVLSKDFNALKKNNRVNGVLNSDGNPALSADVKKLKRS